MPEDPFVHEAHEAARAILPPSLVVRRAAPLLYEVRVTNRLTIAVDPRRPTRGRSAFETDLCVFEDKAEGVSIPRVVLEFKSRLTTHDILTYSAKARKHKLIYPYLRYGLVVSQIKAIPNRFYRHNEALDFFLAAGSYRGERFQEIFARVLLDEIEASRRLEAISSGEVSAHLFQTRVEYESDGAARQHAERTRRATGRDGKRHGIPGIGTLTRRVWEIADSITVEKQRPATRSEVVSAFEAEGGNNATGSTQYGRWRRHHGHGR